MLCRKCSNVYAEFEADGRTRVNCPYCHNGKLPCHVCSKPTPATYQGLPVCVDHLQETVTQLKGVSDDHRKC